MGDEELEKKEGDSDTLSFGMQGEEIRKLQFRLRELHYYEGSIDGVFGPATLNAVSSFQWKNGLLPPDGVANKGTLGIIYSKIARTPSQVEIKTKLIDDDETKRIMNLFYSIISSDDDESRQSAIIEGIIAYGLAFPAIINLTIQTLVKSQDENNKQEIEFFTQKLQNLGVEVGNLLFEWLGGKKYTNRVDEDERRAIVGANVIDTGGIWLGLMRLASRAILILPEEHPARDVSKARQALLYLLERSRILGELEQQLIIIHDILTYKALEPERVDKLIKEGEALLEKVEPDVCEGFLTAVMSYYYDQAQSELSSDSVQKIVNIIEDRDHINLDVAKKWFKLIESAYEKIKAVGGIPTSKAEYIYAITSAFYNNDNSAKIADILKAALVNGKLEYFEASIIAIHEADVRLHLGDYERVIEILSPIIQKMEEAYLSMVDENVVSRLGAYYSNTVGNLAYAQASIGQWETAIMNFEHRKSLRLRYQAALRKNPEGTKLLEVEGQLHALSRGVQIESGLDANQKVLDYLDQSVLPYTKVLEEYRRLRTKLSKEVLATPSISEISSTLEHDEAVVLLGMCEKGLLAAVVCSEDNIHPTGQFLMEEWSSDRFLKLVIGKNWDGWYSALGLVITSGKYLREPLSVLLPEIEKVFVRILESIKEKEIHRITIVPDILLQYIPFWALPSFSEYELLISPSAAHFVEFKNMKHKPSGKVLAVGNPTLDLPLSVAEISSVKTHISNCGVEVCSLERDDATENAIINTLNNTGLFHFCGHGRSVLSDPLKSSLLLSPNWKQMPLDGPQAFRELAESIKDKEWDYISTSQRKVDIPDIGRLIEFDPDETFRERLLLSRSIFQENFPQNLERTLECEGGTLWGLYAKNELQQIAELWTAGDIIVQNPFSDCNLIFLSACRSGFGGITGENEVSGLPVALLQAGVPTIVSTLWPVSDGLTALYVDLFYERLALPQSGKQVNVANLVKKTNKSLSTMKKEDAVSRVKQIRERISKDGIENRRARLKLEAFAYQLSQGEDYPFSHPYDWASFYIMGKGDLNLV